jgi:hypothetical protein
MLALSMSASGAKADIPDPSLMSANDPKQMWRGSTEIRDFESRDGSD